MSKVPLLNDLNQRKTYQISTGKNGLKPAEAARIIEALFEIMKTKLEQNESVLISRFGCFEVQARKGMVCKNLISKKGQVIIPSHRSIKFRCSEILKDRLNSELVLILEKSVREWQTEKKAEDQK